MVRFGNNTFQSIASVVMYVAVLATIGLSIATTINPIMA